MLDRRSLLTSIAAIAGAGAVCKAVEQAPNEPKVLFYVLTLDDSYEDPDGLQIERIRKVFRSVAGEDAQLLIMPAGSKLEKCTELPEIKSVKLD